MFSGECLRSSFADQLYRNPSLEPEVIQRNQDGNLTDDCHPPRARISRSSIIVSCSLCLTSVGYGSIRN
jgi:hypothetical protein